MALVYSAGMLEPEEVQEDIDDCLARLNKAASNGHLFAKLTDETGADLIVQVPEIIKIKASY